MKSTRCNLGSLRAGLAAGLLLLLSACTFPPYDEALSLAALTSREMTLTNEVGPLYLWTDERKENLTVHFLPFKSDLAARAGRLNGYLVLESRYRLQIYPLYHDSSRYWLGGWCDESLSDADPSAIEWVMDVALDSNYLNLYFLSAARRQFRAYNTDGALASIPNPLGESEPENLLALLLDSGLPGSPDRVVGVTRVLEGPGAEQVRLLWANDTSLNHGETGYETNQDAGLTAPYSCRAPFNGLPGWIDRGRYGYHAASDTSYLSVHDPTAGRYRTWRWDNSLNAVEISSLDRRIDAVLSNGLLYSQEDGWATVYSASGSERARFPLGALRLAGEVYVDGVPTLYFTLPAWSRNEDDDEYLAVMVYSLPTSEIDSL